MSDGRLLYVASEFPPVQNAVALRSRFHVKALAKLGANVTVLTGPASRDAPGFDVQTAAVGPPPNDARLLPRFLHELLFGLLLGCRILRSRGVIHVVISSPPFFMTLICAACARLRGIPYTLDVRDRYPEVMFSLGVLSERGLPGRALRACERWLCRGAARIVTVTEGLANRIGRETGGADVELVRNGYDQGLFAPVPEAEGTVRIVMHGNFGKFFDLQTFARIAGLVAERAAGYEIAVIGSGSQLARLRDMKLPRVTVLPEMSQADVAAQLCRCHAGLSVHADDLSMRDAFPVKVFEYIGAGIPAVVVPESEGGRVVQAEGLGACFATGNWEAAAQFLARLVQDRALRARYRATIASKRSDYTRSAQADRFAEVVLARRHRKLESERASNPGGANGLT